MENKKIRVGILFGGRSAEHEVSLQSAKSIVEAIDKDKYEVVLIGIDKQGQWLSYDRSQYLLNENNPKLIKLNNSGKNVTLLQGTSQKQLMSISDRSSNQTIDVVFPVLHGTFGEDGTVQGLLKLADIPFVGADVLGSSVAMDKDVAKRLFKEAGIPIGNFLVFTRRSQIDFDQVVDELGLPFFVKPANLGSSVGINKVHNPSEFETSLKDAFTYDNKILVEEFIKGREIECSVLGNEDPIASIPGEIVPSHEFYSYEAKYIDEKGATLIIPAELSKDVVTNIQNLAVKAFKALCCEGMGRVDFFLKENNQIYLNEINTIPGFTKISMYPKLWEKSGIPYAELIDRLIQLALERAKRDRKLVSSYKL